MTLTRVEGRKFLWACRDSGETIYYYRRLLPFFDNGQKKYKDFRKALGPNMARAFKLAEKLDLECEAVLRGEQPRREATLAQFIGQYVTHMAEVRKLDGVRTVRSSLGRFLAGVGDMPMERVTRQIVEHFLVARRREVAANTILGYLRDIRCMFNVAVSQGYLEKNPTFGIKVERPERKEPRILTDDELVRLLDFLKGHKPWLRPIVVTLVSTGGRLGEVLSLTWDRVDFTGDKLTLVRNKVRDTLTLALTSQLKAELWTIWMERGMPKEGPVFMNKRGVACTTRATYIGFKPVARLLGLPWLMLKTFRPQAATWSAQGTRDPRVAKEVLGHRDLRTTEAHYLGGGKEAREMGVRAIEERLARLLKPAAGGHDGGTPSGTPSAA